MIHVTVLKDMWESDVQSQVIIIKYVHKQYYVVLILIAGITYVCMW